MIMRSEFVKLRKIVLNGDFDSGKLVSKLDEKFEKNEIHSSLIVLKDLAKNSNDGQWMEFIESSGEHRPATFQDYQDKDSDILISICIALVNIIFIGTSIFTIIDF